MRLIAAPWQEQQPEYAGVWLDPEAGQVAMSQTDAAPRSSPVRMPESRAEAMAGALNVPAYTWRQVRKATNAAWRADRYTDGAVERGGPGPGSDWLEEEA